MKFGFLSDTHANRWALEAVLAAADSLNLDALWHLGDALDYGPHPNEVIALLAAHTTSIKGNHDALALGRRTGRISRSGPLAWADCGGHP